MSGDVVRLMVLRAAGRRPEVASSILIERAAAALALRPGHFDDFGLLPVLWCMTVGFTAGDPLARGHRRLIGKRGELASRLMDIATRLSAGLAAYRRRPAGARRDHQTHGSVGVRG